MSLRKAQKHMQRATDLLSSSKLGFGAEKRKLDEISSPSEDRVGVTCYADKNVLEMLGWKPEDINAFNMNLKPLQDGKDHILSNKLSLQAISRNKIVSKYIFECVEGSNMILVTHDIHENSRREVIIGSIRGFAICSVASSLMTLDLIGSGKPQIMEFRNMKKQIRGATILQHVVRLGSKMRDGIELFAVADVIPLYWGFGWRFQDTCKQQRTREHEDHVKTLAKFLKTSPLVRFETVQKFVRPFAVYGKGYFKTANEVGVQKAEEDAYDNGYRMILCPAKY